MCVCVFVLALGIGCAMYRVWILQHYSKETIFPRRKKKFLHIPLKKNIEGHLAGVGNIDFEVLSIEYCTV